VSTTSSGSIRHYGVMANALFDMDIGSPWVYPYLGIGAGYQQTSAVNVAATQNGGPFVYRTNDSQGAFAVQAIVGLSFPIPNMPGLSVTPEYRFMDILGGQKLKGTGTLPVANMQLKNQFDHNFIIGVRYAFNVPPPPMATAEPTPAPATAARSYLVFFDWDKATLNDRARIIVKDAASAATKVAHTRIDVAGNADTSGNAPYNQGLSKRRADAVAAELIKDGVAKTDISVTANGDTHPLVPTGPGVREPQNRRVEIVLR
jgi:OOP family OmpA-OmpF porin